MEWHYLCVILIILLLVYLINTSTIEGWHEWVTDLFDKIKITGYRKIPTEADFKHYGLTTKPYGGSNPMYTYFQNYEKNMGKQYKHCTNQQCSTKQYNGTTAKAHTKLNSTLHSSPTSAQSISVEYYNNPQKYCKRNPHKFPCPNYWLKGK